jgi:hypothetical protein
MSGWIKFWKDMPDDPRLIEAAKQIADRYHLARQTPGGGGEDLSSGDALRFACNALRGALVTLWCYADEHIRNDDTLPMSSDTLDAFVGIEGFFDMVPRDWVTELDNGTVKLPGYCEKNGLIAKEKRATDNKSRQAAWRARQAKNNASSNGVHNKIVTRNEPVTKCVDSDSDSDQDSKTKNKKVPTEPVEHERSTSVTKPPASKASDVPDAVAKVFDHWRTVHHHGRAALDEKRRKLIRNALKHYSEADLCQSISGYLNSPHHMGRNDRATMYTDIELLLRDSGQIDAGLKFYAEPPRTDLSAKTRANVAAISDWKPPELRNAGQ